MVSMIDLIGRPLIVTSLCSQRTAYAHAPTHQRIAFFAVFVVFQIGLAIYAVVRTTTGSFRMIPSLVLTIVTLSSLFTCMMYFFLVTHSMSLCYDDWTTKMLSATAKYSLRDSVKVDLLISNSP